MEGNACPARKKEMQRVERAKQARSIYWHVPPREGTTQQGTQNEQNRIRSGDRGREDTPVLTETAVHTPEARTAISVDHVEESAYLAPPRSDYQSEQTTRAPHQQSRQPSGAEDLEETSHTTMTATLPMTNVWDSAATQQESSWPVTANAPQPAAEWELPDPTAAGDSGQPDALLFGRTEEAMQEADAWLSDMANVLNSEWIDDTAEIAAPTLTSTATNPRTTSGSLFRSCYCPSHQQIYENWPTRDAELTIARCMKICMYCGKDFPNAADLRRHIHRGLRYAERNLSIHYDPPAKRASAEPGWEHTTHRIVQLRRLRARSSRHQFPTDGTSATPSLP